MLNLKSARVYQQGAWVIDAAGEFTKVSLGPDKRDHSRWAIENGWETIDDAIVFGDYISVRYYGSDDLGWVFMVRGLSDSVISRITDFCFDFEIDSFQVYKQNTNLVEPEFDGAFADFVEVF